jgi:hypothetical protein
MQPNAPMPRLAPAGELPFLLRQESEHKEDDPEVTAPGLHWRSSKFSYAGAALRCSRPRTGP